MRILIVFFLALGCTGVLGQTLVMEVGDVSINHTATRVTLNNVFVDPVVIALPAGYIGSHEATVRVANVNPSFFDVFLEEPINRDGPHTMELIHYIVVEKGAYTFGDGTMLEAGTLSASNLNFQGVSLQQVYPNAPGVLTQIQTNNSSTRFLHTRQRNTSGNGFEVKLEREESLNSIAPSSSEEIGYFAIQKKEGVLDGVVFEAGTFTTAQNVTVLNFNAGFSAGLHFVAAVASFDGGDPVTLRRTSLNSSQTGNFLDEDVTNDTETGHVVEEVDFFAVDDNSGAGIFLDAPLKIELLQFDAQLTPDQMVELKWSTTLEFQNGDYFEVERSEDGQDWKWNQSVYTSQSITQDKMNFETADLDPLHANTFYRLKLVDREGSFTYSSIQRVELHPAEGEMQVFPTLVKDRITVTIEGKALEWIRIFNGEGVELTQEAQCTGIGSSQISLELSQFPSGFYWIQTAHGTEKILKME